MARTGACREYVAQLHSYLDGELTDSERSVLRAHLEDCPPCLDEFERDAMLKRLVQRSCACEQAPEQLRTQIMSRISVHVVEVDLHEG